MILTHLQLHRSQCVHVHMYELQMLQKSGYSGVRVPFAARLKF